MPGCHPGDANRLAGPSCLRNPYKLGLHVDERRLDADLAHAEELARRRADVVLLFARLNEPVSGKIRRMMQAGYEVALMLEWWDGGQPHDPRYSPLHEFNGDWYP